MSQVVRSYVQEEYEEEEEMHNRLASCRQVFRDKRSAECRKKVRMRRSRLQRSRETEKVETDVLLEDNEEVQSGRGRSRSHLRQNSSKVETVELSKEHGDDEDNADHEEDENSKSTRVTRLSARVSLLRKQAKVIARRQTMVRSLTELTAEVGASSDEEVEEPPDAAESEVERSGIGTDMFRTCVVLAKKHKIDIREVRDTYKEFAGLDVDGNGILSAEEFEAVLRMMANLPDEEPVPKHLMKQTWSQVDTNCDGGVSFEEYLVWSATAKWKEELMVPAIREREIRRIARENNVNISDVDNLRNLFSSFDTDNSQTIDQNEFKLAVCKLMNVKDMADLSANMLNRYWVEADTDSSGEINFEEFLVWFLNRFQ